jgi:hypothetical protein
MRQVTARAACNEIPVATDPSIGWIIAGTGADGTARRGLAANPGTGPAQP